MPRAPVVTALASWATASTPDMALGDRRSGRLCELGHVALTRRTPTRNSIRTVCKGLGMPSRAVVVVVTASDGDWTAAAILAGSRLDVSGGCLESPSSSETSGPLKCRRRRRSTSALFLVAARCRHYFDKQQREYRRARLSHGNEKQQEYKHHHVHAHGHWQQRQQEQQ